MIVGSLCEYYNRLVDDPRFGIPLYGYSSGRVSFALNLSTNGQLLNVIDLRETARNKLVAIDMTVPEQIKRSSGVAPNFLCDNSSYFLGIDNKEKPARTKQAFEASKELHNRILSSVNDSGAKAVIGFFNSWSIEEIDHIPSLKTWLNDIKAGVNLVFMLEGQPEYIHNRTAIKAAWENFKANQVSDVRGQCLITGENKPIARLHQGVKGVPGGQATGVSLVSFNQDSFESYGKTQSYNSPVSEQAAFAYTTALQHILNNPRQRIRFGDDTVIVFWSDAGEKEEDIFAELILPSNTDHAKDQADDPAAHDPETIQFVHDVLTNVRSGKPIKIEHLQTRSKFYILGLSSNAARIAVRFWHVDTFGSMVDRIAQHYSDIALEPPSNRKWQEFISIYKIMDEIKPPQSRDKAPALYAGMLLRAILTGSPYPEAIYSSIISRVRADHQVNYVRAAVIKGCLERKHRKTSQKEGLVTMSLDENKTDQGYRLGRLFAVLEKLQQDAQGDINATIRDKYFGSASATPGAVFPLLIRLSHHHVEKAKYGHLHDKRIEKILNEVDGFPANLSLEQQGLFILGYYHQREALFKKGEAKDEGNN